MPQSGRRRLLLWRAPSPLDNHQKGRAKQTLETPELSRVRFAVHDNRYSLAACVAPVGRMLFLPLHRRKLSQFARYSRFTYLEDDLRHCPFDSQRQGASNRRIGILAVCENDYDGPLSLGGRQANAKPDHLLAHVTNNVRLLLAQASGFVE
jgi:hypothetical protein